MEKHKNSFKEWICDSKYFTLGKIGFVDISYTFYSKQTVSQEYKEYLQSHK